MQWIPEITHFCPGTPYLLVGMKIDLRDEEEGPTTWDYYDDLKGLVRTHRNPVTQEKGERKATEIQAVKYVECSAFSKVQ